MEIDDDNAPDDHGIFSALSAAHDEEVDENQQQTVENKSMESLDEEQHDADNADGNNGDDAERVLTTLQSPQTVGDEETSVGVSDRAITINIDGVDVIVDTDADGSGSIELVQLTDQTDTDALMSEYTIEGEEEQNPQHQATEDTPQQTQEQDGDSALRARRQLQMLATAKRSKRSTDKSRQSNDNITAHLEISSTSTAVNSGSGAKILKMEITKPAGAGGNVQLIKSMQNRLSQKIDSIYVTPNKPIARADFNGTIEIPKDLIIGPDVELEGDAYVITHAEDDGLDVDNGLETEDGITEYPCADSALHDDDLLAILEGNDDDAAAADAITSVDDGTVISPSGKSNVYVVGVEASNTSPISSSVVLDKDAEMEAAMQQMMSLPQKRKGRPCKPKVDKPPKVEKPKAKSAATKTKELVNSLVQDWSGSESDSNSMTISPQTQPKKLLTLPTKNQRQPSVAPETAVVVALPVTEPAAAFKRTRIIKKKVIWDPDAPETGISYASLVQSNTGTAPATNASRGAPRILNKIPASQDNQTHGSRTPPLQAKRRTAVTSPAAATSASSASSLQSAALQHARKRKVSEVDRLLRDEGAINMLNALKQESHDRSTADGTGDDSLTDENNMNGDDAQQNEDRNSSISPTRQQKLEGGERTAAQNPRSVRMKRPQTPATAITAAAAAAATAKKEAAAKRPRKANSAAVANSEANSWDYFYSHRGDDSLIIRRRSNSSYSSSASTNRLSIDSPAGNNSTSGAAASVSTVQPSTKSSAKTSRAKASTAATSSSFEFAKPNARKLANNSATDSTTAVSTTILMDIRSKPIVQASAATTTTTVHETRRSKRSNATTPNNNNTSNIADEGASNDAPQPPLNAKERKIVAKLSTTGVVTTAIKSATSPATKSENYQEIIVKPATSTGAVHIFLQPLSGELENVFTLQLMREVCKALLNLTNDTACKVVLISSSTETFCNGLNYATLAQPTAEQRRRAAEELSSEVRKFIEALASFPKTLIAAVHGHCVGIGVTILPLFDVVLANATSTFETPYARAGQIPEASSVLLLSSKVLQNAKTELLLLGETLDAEMAQRYQLVTKVLKDIGFDAAVQRYFTSMATSSAQALDALKTVAQSAELASLPLQMADEERMLQEHWTSAEWQNSFQKFLNTNKW